MTQGYTNNICVQMLIALLKKYEVKRVVVSPGTTNLEFVVGLQHSGDFELISAVDERGAAFMACGIAERCGETVVVTCTEATASRDYMPGLTKAYYHKLPLLAVTGVHGYSEIGHLHPQVIDRSVSPKDIFNYKAQLHRVKSNEDFQENEIMINQALLECSRGGYSPY